MTDVNGLRLAYRGLVTGLAAGYVWAAIAMAGALLSGAGPAEPLLLLGGGSGRESLALGIVIAELAAGGTGMAFAYFFGRFFTVRPTLVIAGPCFTVLAWVLVTHQSARLGHLDPLADIGLQAAIGAATLCYGLMLGAGLPTRTEVARYPGGSPST